MYLDCGLLIDRILQTVSEGSSPGMTSRDTHIRRLPRHGVEHVWTLELGCMAMLDLLVCWLICIVKNLKMAIQMASQLCSNQNTKLPFLDRRHHRCLRAAALRDQLISELLYTGLENTRGS